MWNWCKQRPKTVAVVLVSLLLLVAAGGVAGWIYRRERLKRLLWAAAAEAEAAQDWASVELALRRYEMLQGATAESSERIGQAIENGATTTRDRRRAMPFYARAISQDLENHQVRLRLADLRLDEQPLEAIQAAERVMKHEPENPDALRIKAVGLARLTPPVQADSVRLKEAYQALLRAVESQSDHLTLVAETAEFVRANRDALSSALGRSQTDLLDEVDSMLEELVASAEDETEARLTRVLYRRRRVAADADDPLIGEDLERLVELRPASNLIRLLAAGWSVRRAFPALAPQEPGDASEPIVDPSALDEAKLHLGAAMDNRGEDPVPYWSMAQLYWWTGEREAAVAALEQGRQAAGEDNPILNLRLAELQLAEGRWSDAQKTLQTLEQIVDAAAEVPEEPRATSHRERRLQEEAEFSVADLRPLVDLLWVQWWLAPTNPAGDPRRAVPLLDRYAEDVLRPGLRALSLYFRGVAFSSMGKWEEALAAFTQSARTAERTLLPRLAAAHSLYRLGRFRDAYQQYRLALELMGQQQNPPLDEGAIWIEAARAALGEQAQRPSIQRDWRALEEVVDRLRQLLPESPIPLFFEADAGRLSSDPQARPRAEALLEEAEPRFATDPDFWALMASYRIRTSQWATAEKALENWESLTEERAVGLRAELARARGDIEQADQMLEESAASLAVYQQRQLLTQRVQLALNHNRAEHARDLLKGWLEEHPDDALSHFQLAQIAWGEADLETLEQAEQRLRALEGAAGRQTRSVRLQRLLLTAREAAAQEELNELSKSLVDDYPQDRQVRVLQGLVAEALNRPEDAVQAYRRAVESGEQSPAIRLRLAELLHEQGRHNDALALCLSVPIEEGSMRPAILAATVLASAMGRQASPSVRYQFLEEAERIFQVLLQGPPTEELPLLLLNLAVLRERQGRPEEAIALTRRGLELRPQAVELKNNLAWFLAVYGNEPAEARTWIERALEAAGPLPPLLDTQGVVLLKAGEAEEAVRVLEESVKADGSASPQWLHLAEAYHSVGRPNDARRALEEAEERGLERLSPRDQQAYSRLKLQL